MKKQINKKNKFSISDLLFIIISFVFFTIFFILAMIDTTDGLQGWTKWQTYVAFVANVINIANLLLTIKKKISSNYFGLANAILAGLIAWSSQMMWQVVRYWVVCVIGTVITLIVWLKNSKDKKSVETKTGSWLLFAILVSSALILAGFLAWMETTTWFCNAFNISVKPFYLTIFDGLSLSMLIVSIILITLRFNQYWIICYIMYAATLILWIVNMSIEPKTTYDSWQMLLGTILNLCFAIKGNIDWRKNIVK